MRSAITVIDANIAKQLVDHPRMALVALEILKYGDWGYRRIPLHGIWEPDWNDISDVERSCVWHPPLKPTEEGLRMEAIRALAIEAEHPFPNIFLDPLARLQFIGQQMDSGARGLGGLSGPCSWCGTITGLWCDGAAPTQCCFGWSCKVPTCSWCRMVFSECRRCTVHTGIPRTVDRRANIQRCRVSPDTCTARLLRFEEVQATDFALGVFRITMAVENAMRFRISCCANGMIFGHIDAKYGITRDDTPPQESSADEDEDDTGTTTTTSGVQSDGQLSEFADNNAPLADEAQENTSFVD